MKSTISENDFPRILANYDLGNYLGFKTFAHGAWQTTVLLETSKGRFVLRYYENRTVKHVSFEVELLNFLKQRNYPVPVVLKNRLGKCISEYNSKPYIIIEFIHGEHGVNPNDVFDAKVVSEVVEAVATLHNLTSEYDSKVFQGREPFDPQYCWREFAKKHLSIMDEKREWFMSELDRLEFPPSMSIWLCHADLNYGNFLFQNEKVVAVLDFDMSFHWFSIYDIASLIYWWAWPPESGFKKDAAATILSYYLRHRKLTPEEQIHIFDALKLIILLGISWSDEGDFEPERSKIEFLNSMWRDEFSRIIFPNFNIAL